MFWVGFLVIYAKFSDIFGIKFMILLALLVFTAFSIVCGAATGMTELCVPIYSLSLPSPFFLSVRGLTNTSKDHPTSLQGIGGSGIYSMVGVVTISVVPTERYGKYMAIISSVMIVSSILGPLLGGFINDHTTWRWVFLAQCPCWRWRRLGF
jgi:MFS family permease